MRLTVRLDEDVYTTALALAQSEGISIGKAINRLVRRSIQARPLPVSDTRPSRGPSSFPISRGKRLIVSHDVRRTEQDEDDRALGAKS
jgi:antitoxin component of RelBE/YafQ-DinJ toxin-antitoxin module